LYELYDSYQRFFRGEQVHPPQFKKKSKANISFTESDPATFEIEEARKRVRLPKLGWVKCRFPQHIEGKPTSVTVQWNGVRWVLPVQSKVEIADQTHPSDTIVAGDFGVVRRVTFSDGVVVPSINVSWEEKRKSFSSVGSRTSASSARTGRRWLTRFPSSIVESPISERMKHTSSPAGTSKTTP